jgi:hypothetical protein
MRGLSQFCRAPSGSLIVKQVNVLKNNYLVFQKSTDVGLPMSVLRDNECV